jgi:hypothetical protein
MALDAPKIRGVKISLLDADRERQIRSALMRSEQIVLTGDDFNFGGLIRGDDQTVQGTIAIGKRAVAFGEFSHALLGVLDAVAEPVSRALDALERGDLAAYDAIMAPCEELGRWIFQTPDAILQIGPRLSRLGERFAVESDVGQPRRTQPPPFVLRTNVRTRRTRRRRHRLSNCTRTPGRNRPLPRAVIVVSRRHVAKGRRGSRRAAIAGIAFTVCTIATAQTVVVDVQEDVYTYVNANNGSGPLWSFGCTSIARIGDDVYVNEMETGENVEPLSNTRWRLLRRDNGAWTPVAEAHEYRQREPCSLAVTGNAINIYVNDSLTEPGAHYQECFPHILRLTSTDSATKISTLIPRWNEPTTFTDHSYRGSPAIRKQRNAVDA